MTMEMEIYPIDEVAKIRTPLNRHLHCTNGRVFTKPSMTIPDQTLSIRELLVRYANGQTLEGRSDVIWDEQELSRGINPKTLDLAELQELAERNKQTLDSYNDYLERRAKQKAADEKDNEINAKVKQLLAEARKEWDKGGKPDEH